MSNKQNIIENNNSDISIRKTPPVKIDDNSTTKVFITKNKIELVTVKHSISNISNYKKLSGNMSINISTRECIEHKPPRSRKDNHASIRRSGVQLSRIINNNFSGDDSEKHAVLTYAKPVTDYKQVNSDFKKFINRFRYKFGSVDYIKILEPSSDRWHIHLLLKSNAESLNIDYKELQKIWKLGHVFVNNVPLNPNFGTYFCMSFLNNQESEES